MSGHLCLKWNNHSAAFISSISNIQTKEKYCDATIACQGKYFPVHRVILSTCSEYFEEMFERIVCPHPYIVFKDIEPTEMELLLNYMYQGEVNVVQEKLPSLIKAAEALKIKGLAVPDDLPNTKESSGRKRSHQGDDNSSSKRRNDEKRKRSSDLSSHSDSCRDSIVSPGGPEEKEELKLIKEEPVDNSEYIETNVLSNEFSSSDQVSADNILPSASNETGDLNKSENEYPEYIPVEGENSFIKSEEPAPPEESYDNQSSSWTDFGDSDMQNLNLPQTSQQDDIFQSDEGWNESIESDNIDCSSSCSIPLYNESSTNLDQTIKKSKSLRGILHHCPFCSYVNVVLTNVKRHVMFRHTREKPFKCLVCPKKFTLKRDLQTHSRTHTGEKPFECLKCLKRFSTKGGLRYHLRNDNNECSKI